MNAVRIPVTCPACGTRLDPAAEAACHACPVHRGCQLICCPACGSTVTDPGRSRLARWLARVLPGGRPVNEPALDVGTPGSAQPDGSDRGSPVGVRLADLPAGAQARVVRLGALPGRCRERLEAYGLTPGYLVRVIQRSPVTVVRVDHTELALERELARGVWVKEVA